MAGGGGGGEGRAFCMYVCVYVGGVERIVGMKGSA